jgi:aspartyl-tRNA(Asn)/glutamyl-tRNA(Gln) amidotransferase subunit B
MELWKLPQHDAGLISCSRPLAEFFEATVDLYGEAKTVGNWILGELLRLVRQEQSGLAGLKLTPKQLAQLLKMIDTGTINGKIAKTVLETMFKTGKDPEVIVAERGLTQITDSGQLKTIVTEVLNANEKTVFDYLKGKEQALRFLVGQVMKGTKGKANPEIVNQMLQQELEKRRTNNQSEAGLREIKV